jgi:hypothetical protein
LEPDGKEGIFKPGLEPDAIHGGVVTDSLKSDRAATIADTNTNTIADTNTALCDHRGQPSPRMITENDHRE